jgi:Tol biopolymer transport system component
MTAPIDNLERDLTIWLEAEGQVRAPDWLHDAAIGTAVHTRQRAGWLVRLRSTWVGSDRPGHRRRFALGLAVAVGSLVLVLVAAWLIGSRPAPEPEGIRNGQVLVARQLDSPRAEYLTMDADGSDERRLFEAEDCGQCAWWSPDGRRIMYPETANGRLTTAIVRSDGAAKVVLQPLPGSTVNLGPGGWSPDGSLIALAGWDDTDATRRGIYVATPEGTELRQVSRSTDGRPHDWTTFSPDGSRILYIATDADGPSNGGIAGDLRVVTVDGTEDRQVNPVGTKVVASVRVGRPMDWSPDGGQIVFAAIEGDLDAGRSAVFLANGDGTGARRISDWSTRTTSVDWAPEGPWVLAGDSNDGIEAMWLIDARSAERRDLWSSTADDPACCGTWSPDGELILFERGPSGSRDLWTMRPDGTVVQRVTHLPADYVWYSWAPAAD